MSQKIAIINVNIDNDPQHIWYRAFANTWLQRLQHLVTPFAKKAHYSYGVLLAMRALVDEQNRVRRAWSELEFPPDTCTLRRLLGDGRVLPSAERSSRSRLPHPQHTEDTHEESPGV